VSEFKVGDVVYVMGSSAILGDVIEVEENEYGQRVTVTWRETTTTESPADLEKADPADYETWTRTAR